MLLISPFEIFLRPGASSEAVRCIEKAVGILSHVRRPLKVLVGFCLHGI